MANFLLVYTGGNGMPATDAERAKVMEAWGAWFGKLGDAVVDPDRKLIRAGRYLGRSCIGMLAVGSGGMIGQGIAREYGSGGRIDGDS